MEDSEAEFPMGMGNVVAGLSQSHAGGAYVGGGAGAIRIGFDFIPKSIEISACCHVVYNSVERIGDPISGRRGVTLQQSLGGNGADHKVVLDDVVCLNTVLHENVVSFNQVSHVLFNSKVMSTVNGQNSGVGMMHCNSTNKTVGCFSNHMVVRAIPGDDLGLAAFSNLSI